MELAVEVITIEAMIETSTETRWKGLGTLCNNIPIVIYSNNMASKSNYTISGRLLQPIVIMIHKNHMGKLTTMHIARDNNILADIASFPKKSRNMFLALISPWRLPNTLWILHLFPTNPIGKTEIITSNQKNIFEHQSKSACKTIRNTTMDSQRRDRNWNTWRKFNRE